GKGFIPDGILNSGRSRISRSVPLVLLSSPGLTPSAAILGRSVASGRPNRAFHPASSVLLCDIARTLVHEVGRLAQRARHNTLVWTSSSETQPRLLPEIRRNSAAQ